MKKLQHITINKLNKKMKGTNNLELKLDGVNQRRITLTTNKKEYTSFSIIK